MVFGNIKDLNKDLNNEFLIIKEIYIKIKIIIQIMLLGHIFNICMSLLLRVDFFGTFLFGLGLIFPMVNLIIVGKRIKNKYCKYLLFFPVFIFVNTAFFVFLWQYTIPYITDNKIIALLLSSGDIVIILTSILYFGFEFVALVNTSAKSKLLGQWSDKPIITPERKKFLQDKIEQLNKKIKEKGYGLVSEFCNILGLSEIEFLNFIIQTPKFYNIITIDNDKILYNSEDDFEEFIDTLDNQFINWERKSKNKKL